MKIEHAALAGSLANAHAALPALESNLYGMPDDVPCLALDFAPDEELRIPPALLPAGLGRELIAMARWLIARQLEELGVELPEGETFERLFEGPILLTRSYLQKLVGAHILNADLAASVVRELLDAHAVAVVDGDAATPARLEPIAIFGRAFLVGAVSGAIRGSAGAPVAQQAEAIIEALVRESVLKLADLGGGVAP